MGRHLRVAFRTPHHSTSATLHEDEQNVRAAIVEQAVFGRNAALGIIIEGGKNAIGLIGREITGLLAEIALFEERIEERKDGIDGRVVVILVGGIVDHADVGRRSPYSTADAEEKQCADEQERERMHRALHGMRRGKTRTTRVLTIGARADAPK